MKGPLLLAVLVAGVTALPAFAQGTAAAAQRDAIQQQRIENGLQSGALTTREAGALERSETRVDQLQAHSMRDGTLAASERARIRAAQDRASARIGADKHNARTGDPQSRSSRRMQADVQRNANQAARIRAGVASGELSGREVAALERGQARVTRREAGAAANGRVGAVEQARVQGRESVQSARIHRERHD